jgi:hypothetical protein
VQQCDVVITNTLTTENVAFDMENVTGIIFGTKLNNEWDIKSAKVLMNPNVKSFVKFTFDIQRHSGFHIASSIFPAIALAFINFLVVCLKPESFSRSILCGVNIYLHFSLMDRVWWQLINFNFSFAQFFNSIFNN